MYTTEEQIQFYMWYLEGSSLREVAALFSVQYPNRPIPSHPTIANAINKLKTSGCINTIHNKKRSTRPRNSGFPFDDRDFDRDRSHSSFRTQLDDIARRHPEFAEHLNIGGGSFPFRSHTLGRHPRRGSDAEKPSGSQDTEFRRPHDRAFSRFDNFDFPFHKYFDEDAPDFYEAGYRIPPERQPQFPYASHQPPPEETHFQQQAPQQQYTQPNSSHTSPSSKSEKPPQIPQTREGARKQNIQQSNTVDLGQKQEPVDENRGQRSMSAPPENRSTGQRFVSSINIPIQRPVPGGTDMGAKASTQAQEPPQPQSNKPNERVIPIHVEGRDEPIIPKNVNTTFTQPPPQQQQQPQTERIFGRNPSQFTQFLNRGEPHNMTPEEHYRQQQQQYQKQQQQNFQQQQNQNTAQEPQPEPETQFSSQSAPPPSAKATQLDQIQNIQKDVNELMNQVEKFNGKPKDKQYLYLDEMLTRNLIKLDNIETEGKDNIRQARKEAIKCIEGCIGILEAKANANLAAELKQEQDKMEIAQSDDAEKLQQESQVQPDPTKQGNEISTSSTTNDQIAAEQVQTPPAVLEISGVARTGSVVNVTPMEVTPAEELNQEQPQPEKSCEEKKSDGTALAESLQKPEEAKNSEKIENEKKIELKEDIKDNVSISQESKQSDESDVAKSNSATQTNEKEIAASSDDKKEKKKGKKKDKTG
ncbi:bcl2-associated athanogene [Holotrichia oblita]|uniref:Bcl2-associated athanogene n=1 Tax=Holotrichia oblita TaxID=644536 RepID=A0ACB9SNP0_HOLOL|nr:bcl2-associated athanogene [Holotrichia oblita]